MPLAQKSLTLSRDFGMSSRLYPVSSHCCCMYVRAGRPAFAWPYVGVHRSTSLMSSSLLLQQSPACLVRLTWIVFVMGGRWPYSWCFVMCCRQGILKKALNSKYFNPVSWGCRIHRLHHCRGVRPHRPTSVPDMTLNHLI